MIWLDYFVQTFVAALAWISAFLAVVAVLAVIGGLGALLLTILPTRWTR